MKLLEITNRYHFFSIIIVLLVGGIMGYYLLRDIINKEFNEKLYADKEQFLYEWKTYGDLRESLYLNIGDRVDIEVLPTNDPLIPTLTDTIMWDDFERKELPFRQLRFSDSLDGKNYAITITKSLLPNEDLIRGVGEFILILIVVLILSLTLINGFIFRKIWHPFFDTLAQLENFNIGKASPFNYQKSNIKEFDELNAIVDKMLTQIQKDYINLKEFTENASHEIKTPLAIIKSKMENLLQDQRLTNDQLQELAKINESVNRLSRLKSGLTLLTKLDNNQYSEKEKIHLKQLIQDKLNDFSDLFQVKRIALEADISADPISQMHPELASILFNNLLGNAVKHNVADGFLKVTLSNQQLTIENSGEPLKNAPEDYFQRFKKDSTLGESSGLGLALVRRICDLYEIPIVYHEQNGVHRVELLLKK